MKSEIIKTKIKIKITEKRCAPAHDAVLLIEKPYRFSCNLIMEEAQKQCERAGAAQTGLKAEAGTIRITEAP